MEEDYLTPEQRQVIDNKPNGNMPDIFPQEFINRNEEIIYAGRPSIISFIARPIIVFVMYFVLIGAPIFYLLSLARAQKGADYWLGFFLLFLFVLPMLFSVLRWSRTYYAMTERRVTHTYGLFSKQSSDIPIDKVMSILMVQPFFERIFGYGSIVYTTAGAGGSMKLKNFYRTGAVVWRAAKNPVQLKNYVQEVTDILLKAQKAKEYKEMAKAMKE